MPGNIKNASVRLLTFRSGGHTLNRRQALSPKRDWAVFDTRNDDTLIGQTHSVERVALKTGKIETIYETVGQTAFGPGVGAVAYHPTLDRVLFIHGVLNCDASRPYGMARRFGAIVDVEDPKSMFPAEGRIVDSEPPLGILSGGTHAHSWSPSGKRISFTYNDARNVNMARTVSKLGNSYDKSENFGGRFASFLVLIPGTSTKLVNGQSVVIQQALEECWLDEHRLAFLGTVESDGGQPIQEIFVATIPSDVLLEAALKSGSKGMVPPGVTLERITKGSFTGPRVSGPRHWLTANPSGAWIYTLAKDQHGIVQLARVASTGGSLELLTQLTESIEGQMSCSPSGDEVGFICRGKVHVWSRSTRSVDCWEDSQWIDSDGKVASPPILDSGYVGAIHFVDCDTIIANRYIRIDDSPYLQIVEVH
jgi:hypothetical protein